MKEKTKTLLGFAAKARKLSYGMEASVRSAKTKKARLMLVCNDVSEKSQKEIAYYSNKFNLPFMVLNEPMQELSKALGRKCGILSVNDDGFRDSIIQEENQ